MSILSVQYQDIITITICYSLFWGVIIILILYPKLRLRKILKRIENFEKNLD